MKAYDIIELIEKTAPLASQASWDASGVQVASVHPDVRRVAVMLDPTLPELQKACARGANFILAHHPLSIQPRFPAYDDAYLAVLSLLLKHDIWLYSAHTSLDANPEGPAPWLAGDLGLVSVKTLQPHAPGTSPYGFGFTGLLPESMPYPAFSKLLARCLGKDSWQACGPVPEHVTRVACCPGSGGSLLCDAIQFEADVYITGDFKYHSALEAGVAGLRVLDVGHFCLEEEMMRRFAALLAADLSLPVDFFPGRDPIVGECAPRS